MAMAPGAIRLGMLLGDLCERVIFLLPLFSAETATKTVKNRQAPLTDDMVTSAAGTSGSGPIPLGLMFVVSCSWEGE